MPDAKATAFTVKRREKRALSAQRRSQYLRNEKGEFMEAIASHREWIVWQQSIALATALHLTTCAESSNSSGLREQMRATSITIATHVAESVAIANRSERIRMLCTARSLLARIEVQLQICQRMQVAGDLPKVNEQIAMLGRLIDSVIQRLREQPNRDARSTLSSQAKRPISASAAAAAT
jgi:four helix bundle protein